MKRLFQTSESHYTKSSFSDFWTQIFAQCRPREMRSCSYKSSAVGGTQNPSIRPSELRARQKFALREKSFLGAVLDIAYDAWHSLECVGVWVWACQCVGKCMCVCKDSQHPASAWDSQGCLPFAASRFEFTMNSILRQATFTTAPAPFARRRTRRCRCPVCRPCWPCICRSFNTRPHRPRLRNIWWVVQIQLVETFLFALFRFWFFCFPLNVYLIPFRGCGTTFDL